MSLEDRINRRESLRAEGWPKTLADLFERTGFTLDNCAHLCVDNQTRFIDSPEVEAASNRISNYIAPSFNRLGIITYWIIWPVSASSLPSSLLELQEKNFMDGAEQLHDVRLADIDKVIPKNCRSAFMQWSHGDAPTLTEEILEKDEIDILLVTGFYADSCLIDTAEDACEKGYLVVWLEDGTNINEYQSCLKLKERLCDNGIILVQSEDALQQIRHRALHKPAVPI